MWRPVLTPSALAIADAAAFVRDVDADPFFEASGPVFVARAPGRLDVMGGIADYSGSLVLQWPLREATLAAVQIASDGLFQVRSLTRDEGRSDRSFETPMESLFPEGKPLDYDEARAWFKARGEDRWSGYILGALLVLSRERDLQIGNGFRVRISSSVPEGKGVSSSAALEVSVMSALGAALGVHLPPRDVALLCQIVENRIVGAPCGVMDQMTSACGVQGEFLSLLCQPAELREPVALPESLELFGLDSGVRHSVSGSDYTSVRNAAFMGARILSDSPGFPNGPLVNVSPSMWEAEAARVPRSMQGRDFINKYGRTLDTVTQPEPERAYEVRAATAHPVHEHFRVRTFARLLAGPMTDETCQMLGELMYQSHASYSACGLGSSATDSVVDIVRAAGPARGFFGAKITGGGSGGTVAILARKGAAIEMVADEYARRSGHRPHVFSGSSPGAAAFGFIQLGAVPGS